MRRRIIDTRPIFWVIDCAEKIEWAGPDLNWGPWRNPFLSPCKGLTDFSDVLTELDDRPEFFRPGEPVISLGLDAQRAEGRRFLIIASKVLPPGGISSGLRPLRACPGARPEDA